MFELEIWYYNTETDKQEGFAIRGNDHDLTSAAKLIGSGMQARYSVMLTVRGEQVQDPISPNKNRSRNEATLDSPSGHRLSEKVNALILAVRANKLA